MTRIQLLGKPTAARRLMPEATRKQQTARTVWVYPVRTVAV